MMKNITIILITHTIKKLALSATLLVLLNACQMPSYNPISLPSGPSGPSGPSIPSAPSEGSAGQNSPTSGTAEGSAGESIEDLDRTLDESLEGFDDNMGSTAPSASAIDILSPSGNTDIQSDTTETQLEDGNAGDDGAMITENEGLAERASSGMEGQTTNPSNSENTQSGRTDSSSSQQGQSTGSTPIPDDIGDGQGDNIVQRQIREAAIKETDPTLRDRLWDEYRKIKNQ